jgi:hypothetical protein
MPLTSFQKDVLAVIRANRSEESHFAGGMVLNYDDNSSRFSRDFDIFHESANEVVVSSRKDVETLCIAGYQVDLLARGDEWNDEKIVSFRKARVSKGADEVEIDWAADSAFRFFPVVQDDDLGWRLHHFDLAINKAHALSARTETRDYIDIIELGQKFNLAAICWAAPGKDPGFSPLSLLKMMLRFARIDPQELDKIQARQLDPITLKNEWTEMSDKAEADMIKQANEHPRTPIGVAFVDKDGQPGWIGDDQTLKPHPPCIRGCWPVVHLNAPPS